MKIININLNPTKEDLNINLFLLMTINFIISINFTLCVKFSKAVSSQFDKNQIFDYPNTYEAPVSSLDLKKYNYTPPLMSQSLFEENPQRKIRIKEFMSTIKYSLYKMTRGEFEQVFNFADMNHDDLIDQQEWDAFLALFVYPYEACDTTGDYLLNSAEFKRCFKADPRASLIEFPEKFNTQKFKVIMDVLATRKDSQINFSDYLIFRRALFGWKECQSGSMYISPRSFQCALRSSLSIKFQLKIESDTIYQIGLKIANNKGSEELDFISYLRMIYFSYVFSILNLPNDSPYINDVQFVKAIKEDRFPTFFSENEVIYLFQLINTNPFQHAPNNNVMSSHVMNFESFSFFFNLHRLFHKYSSNKEQLLNYKELDKLLDNYLFPTQLRFAIDKSKTNFTKSQYLEVSMILHRLRLNERDFFFSFKSVQNQLKVNKIFDKIKKKFFILYYLIF